MTSNTQLRVVIVGAGLCGLACGVALRRQGQDVQIFEKSAFKNEIGAAIALPRNVTRIMSLFGYKPANVRPSELHFIKIYAHDTAEEPYITLPTRPDAPKDDFPSYQVHRVDLHNELKRLATDQSGPGKPCKLHLSSMIQSCDTTNTSITLDNGEIIHADLILIADGLHSKLRPQVLKNPSYPFKTGYIAYRFVLPSSVVKEDPALSWLSKDFLGVKLAQDAPTCRRIVFYPCRDNAQFNVVAMYKNEALDPNSIDNQQLFPPDEMISKFKDFHPRYVKILQHASSVRVWPLWDFKALDTWVNGNIALVGDAAHAMLPHVAQGGAMCIEDAGTLGALFPSGTSRNQVTVRLRLFESLRKSRCTMFQSISTRTASGEPFRANTGNRDFISFAYDYDAVAVAKEALAKE